MKRGNMEVRYFFVIDYENDRDMLDDFCVVLALNENEARELFSERAPQAHITQVQSLASRVTDYYGIVRF